MMNRETGMYSLSTLLEAITMVFPGKISFSNLNGVKDSLRFTWREFSFRVQISTCTVEECSEGLLIHGPLSILVQNMLRLLIQERAIYA